MVCYICLATLPPNCFFFLSPGLHCLVGIQQEPAGHKDANGVAAGVEENASAKEQAPVAAMKSKPVEDAAEAVLAALQARALTGVRKRPAAALAEVSGEVDANEAGGPQCLAKSSAGSLQQLHDLHRRTGPPI